jgi:hypothetical protein
VPSDLGRTITRALFRAVVPTYIQQGLSANQMILDWRQYAPGYQRSLMLQDIRTLQGLIRDLPRQQSFPRDKPVPKTTMPTFEGVGQGQYRYEFYSNLYNQSTGESDRLPLTYYSDEWLSPEDAEIWAEGMTDVDLYKPGWAISSMNFRGVLKRGQGL